jgi:RNA polymerase sigma factor (sigma-70 family)
MRTNENGTDTVATFENVGALYARLSRRLEQIVRVHVRAPEPVIEDACQFAWSRLLHRRDDVRQETALAWLAKVAVHEAFKLIRREDRELSLDAALEGATGAVPRPFSPSPDEVAQHRERLAAVGCLPVRQQRIVWLRALGLSYDEMASYEHCTPRTVERQLLRARSSMRIPEAAAE